MTVRATGIFSGMVFWLFASASFAASPVPYDRFTKSVAEHLIVPGYEQFAAAATRLASELSQACAGALDTDAVRSRHAALLDAWHTVRFVDFGPIETSTGPARVQFWPDSRGVGRRQLRRVLKALDETVTDPRALKGKSVALGDLQALEYLLFGPDGRVLLNNSSAAQSSVNEPGASGAFRCAYARAVARRQQHLAETLLATWQGPDGHRAMMSNPSDANPHYLEITEPAESIYGGLLTTLEDLAVVRIGRPLGKPDGPPKPKRAESWRSRRSLANIVATLRSAQAVLDTEGGLADLFTGAGDAALASAIKAELAAALRLAEAVPAPLFDTLAQAPIRDQLRSLQAHITRVHKLLAGPGTELTKLRPGFNSSDGDG
ncbi:MAG: imelysin family protein [Pseudomonadota bacterium]